MGTQQLSTPKIFPVLFLLTLLLFPSPPQAAAFQFLQWRILFSLSHSLMHRVASARASRGDLSGAERARKIAEKLEGGFRFWGGFRSMGRDYMKNYAWRVITSDSQPEDMLRAVSDMNELLRALNEVTRLESDRQRARWVSQNYQRVLRISKSILGRFLVIFSRSGSLQEMLLILQKEVEGDLLRDCIEIGANDLKGLLQVAKDNDLKGLLQVAKDNDLKGLLQVVKDIALLYMSSPSPSHPLDDL